MCTHQHIRHGDHMLCCMSRHSGADAWPSCYLHAGEHGTAGNENLRCCKQQAHFIVALSVMTVLFDRFSAFVDSLPIWQIVLLLFPVVMTLVWISSFLPVKPPSAFLEPERWKKLPLLGGCAQDGLALCKGQAHDSDHSSSADKKVLNHNTRRFRYGSLCNAQASWLTSTHACMHAGLSCSGRTRSWACPLGSTWTCRASQRAARP